MITKQNLFALTVFIAGLSMAQPSTAQQASRKVKETLVSVIEESEMIGNSFTFSLDIRRIAYRIIVKGKQIAVVDTLLGKPYDEVSAPVFSSDSRHFAYTAKKGKNNLLIIDHKQNLMLDSLTSITSILFSSDNKSVSYILFDGRQYYMVFHGAKGKPYDGIDENSITFTADGSKIAYSAVKGKKQLNVYNGVEGPLFNKVGFPILSPDGKRLAYWAVDGNQTFVIEGNKRSKPYEFVKAIVFSSDGKHLAFYATLTGKYIMVYNDVESEMFQFIHSPTFSPDGTSFVYAFETFEEDKKAFYNYAFVNGKRKGPYETCVEGTFRFSNDGSSLAFETEVHDEFFMVLNGVDGKHYSDVMQATQVFSPDNLHYAYVAENFDSRRVVNLDGKESLEYEDVYSVAFSTDSKKHAYSVRLNNKEYVVSDGFHVNTYDQILGLGYVVYDSADTFHYLALKEGKVYLVEETHN